MEEILTLLPVLFVGVAMNTCAGVYYNVGTKNLKFSWNTFIAGIIKAIIVGGIFIGAAYCFEATDLSSLGITPDLIMTSAITLYVGKAVVSLGKILGIETINGGMNGRDT